LASEDAVIESELKGKTLLVYMHILKNPDEAVPLLRGAHDHDAGHVPRPAAFLPVEGRHNDLGDGRGAHRDTVVRDIQDLEGPPEMSVLNPEHPHDTGYPPVLISSIKSHRHGGYNDE